MPIFYPFRALGYITESTPLSVQRRGQETFVTVSVGKAWQIFNTAKLTLLFVGPQLEKTIRALASWRDFTYAASGSDIAVFSRALQVGTWKGHSGRVLFLLPFGPTIISVGEDRKVLSWPVETLGEDGKLLSEILLPEGFSPTCIMHPDTYLNKVLIGSEQGSLQLWNLKSKKMIFEFKGWGSAVRCCTSSPALDTVAVGCADGKVHIHNLKFDETLLSFSHTGKGPVTALSFRSDGQPLLAAGGLTGIISIWNLEKKKLQTVIKDAHDGAIVSLHFFPREPVLLSSGADNSMKMWIFDSQDGEARLLRFRSGHSAPPLCVQYYGNGRHLLSAGQDRAFRMFSTIQDQQSRELSQGHVGKRAKRLHMKEEEVKLPRVTAFAAAAIRERDWCNVVTCHEGEKSAYTWRLQNFVIGEHVLEPPGGESTPIKSVAISACGNFAILGSQGGRIDRFNLQSGIHRGSYQPNKLQYSPAHNGAVVGLASDATNRHLFSAGYDGFIKVWHFKSGNLKATLNAEFPIVKMAYHRGNGLLVVASDDWILRVFDSVSGRLVRKFLGHSDRVTDMGISEDGRWLISSSMDLTLRTWDLMTAHQIDCMRCDVAVTGLTLSPSMDTLATIHVNRNGIYLWANRIMFSGVAIGDNLGSGESVQSVELPGISSGIGGNTENDENMEEDFEMVDDKKSEKGVVDVQKTEGEGEGDNVWSGKQLTPELITLSMLPRTQWQNLVNLDIIKERNKPILPPKKPEKSPFFLPTIPSLSADLVFAPTTPNKDGEGEGEEEGIVRSTDFFSATRLSKNSMKDFRSEFAQRLHEGAEMKDYSGLVELLRKMSPSAIDLELRMMEIVEDLEDVPEEDLKEIELFLDFLVEETKSKKNFELIQAIIHRTLTIHGDAISQHIVLKEKGKELLEIQGEAWKGLDDMFQRVRCMVEFLSNTQQ